MPGTPGETAAPRPVAGIPAGLVAAVTSILGDSTAPVRRRRLLEELERRGHRVSLAGVNRVLQHLLETGRTIESPQGVQLRR